MSNKYEKLRKSYNKTYKSYDFPKFNYADRFFIKALIQKFSIKEKARCLDVGCGTGNETNILQSLGLNPIGADISDVAIDIAKKKHSSCEFLRIDLTKKYFNDDYFDVIFCNGYSPLSNKLDDTTKKEISVLVDYLKPKGKIIFVMTTNATISIDGRNNPSVIKFFNGLRTNYNPKIWEDFLKSVPKLFIVGNFTLQPHLFLLFKKFTFNKLFSKFCYFLTKLTKIPLRTYIILEKK